jgi:pimeloyl-ACP methyl ester carboxylesterase
VLVLPILLAACVIGNVNAQCGTLTVPENRAQPAGPQIALRVGVLPATVPSVRRADPLFYITGGPGGVDLDALPSVAGAFAAINTHRDIVFVDQRGVGGSNPLSCVSDMLGRSIPEFVAACLGQVDADVTMYRTPEAMDDLDVVRQALGYGKIDLYGASYGATAAQVYLKRHPESVRTVVLDGGTLLDIPVFERWASNAQRALKLLDRHCKADKDCAKAFPRWYQRFPALLKRRAGAPVKIGGVTVDAASTASAVDELTATAEGAAVVPFVLAKAEAGNYGPLARRIASFSSASARIPIMPTVIECTEPWAVADPARVAVDAKGTYLAYSWPASVTKGAQICAAFPPVDTTGEDWSRPRSDLPVLALVGGADPKDPIGNLAGIQEALPNGKIVFVPEHGHGVAHRGCLPVVIDQFLERGTTTGLDARCATLTPTPPFRLR